MCQNGIVCDASCSFRFSLRKRKRPATREDEIEDCDCPIWSKRDALFCNVFSMIGPGCWKHRRISSRLQNPRSG